MTLDDGIHLGLDARGEVLGGEGADGMQAENAVGKVVDGLEHRRSVGRSTRVVAEGDRHPRTRVAAALRHAVLPFVLTCTAHHQQIAMAETPGE